MFSLKNFTLSAVFFALTLSTQSAVAAPHMNVDACNSICNDAESPLKCCNLDDIAGLNIIPAISTPTLPTDILSSILPVLPTILPAISTPTLPTDILSSILPVLPTILPTITDILGNINTVIPTTLPTNILPTVAVATDIPAE